MDKCFALLKSWCDRLIELQIREMNVPDFEGGIMCPACTAIHGRIGDAVYPFVFLYDRTGERKYLEAAQQVIAWSERNVLRPDGAYRNDKLSAWKGITVFSMIALGNALKYHGACLDEATRDGWMRIFTRFAAFIRHTFDLRNAAFRPNVNYDAAGAHAMALAYVMLGDDRYAQLARELSDYTCALFRADGLLSGEGLPIDYVSPRGCVHVDLGYNVEESLPSLIACAGLLGDEATLRLCAEKFAAHIEFMLPDGGWDNSWGSRAAKWTYWGSRTSDGAQAGLCALAKFDPMFAEAARRNFELYERCTKDGLLHGGLMYVGAGEEPCVHHAFCHAKALCALLDSGFAWPKERASLPRDKAYGVKHFGSANVDLIARAGWRATVSNCDALMANGVNGTGGGTLTMLWHEKTGPVFAATMAQYKQSEPMNMQLSRRMDYMSPCTLRIEDGAFMSANDTTARVHTHEGADAVRVTADGVLKGLFQEDGHTAYRFEYAFADAFTVTAHAAKDCDLILPLISADGDEAVLEGNTLTVRRGDATVILRANVPLTVDRPLTERNFHVVGGFATIPVRAKITAWQDTCVTVEIK